MRNKSEVLKMTYRAIAYYRSGTKILVSEKRQTIDNFILSVRWSRYLSADEYNALRKHWAERGGHPPVVSLD